MALLNQKNKNTLQLALTLVFLCFTPILLWLILLPKTKNVVDATNSKILNEINNTEGNWSIFNRINTKTLDKFALSKDLKNKAIPTNTWWLPALYTDITAPIYVLPYSIKFDDNRIEYANSEKITAQSYLIVKPHISEFDIILPGVSSRELANYSDFSFTENFLGPQKNIIGNITVTKGSPYSFYNLETTSLQILKTSGILDIKKIDNNSYLVKTHLNTYLIYSETFKDIEISSSGGNIEFNNKTNRMTIALLDSMQNLEVFIKYANNPIITTAVSYQVSDSEVITSYIVTTEKDSETLLALLPTQYENMPSTKFLGEYDSLRGSMKIIEGKKFNITSTAIIPEEQFNPINVTDTELAEMDTLFKTDTKKLHFKDNGVYFAGKELFRMSNLVDVAKYLDDKLGGNRTSDLVKLLEGEFEDWMTYTLGETSKYFEYDRSRGGMIGILGEFDSQNYNDHHFHYGYYIYSFATICKYNSEFCDKYQSFIDLLVKDVANNDRENTQFPYLRVFDQYESHSWATGLNLLADGNNQESISEAINCWFAIYKLGKVTNNKNYEDLGLWLYNSEINAAKTYWWDTKNNEDIFPVQYDYPYATIVWSGKVEVNTFFSQRPEAKFAILVLPVNAGSLYLRDKQLAERIFKLLDRETNSKYILFEDVINQYKILNKLPYKNISDWELDGVNTYSYSYFMSLFVKNNL